jgi:hypothetical protein
VWLYAVRERVVWWWCARLQGGYLGSRLLTSSQARSATLNGRNRVLSWRLRLKRDIGWGKTFSHMSSASTTCSCSTRCEADHNPNHTPLSCHTRALCPEASNMPKCKRTGRPQWRGIDKEERKEKDWKSFMVSRS